MADIAVRGAGDGAGDARLATIMRNGRARRRRRHATAVGLGALAAVVLVGAFDLAVRDQAPVSPPVAARPTDGSAGVPAGSADPGTQPPGGPQAPPGAVGTPASDPGSPPGAVAGNEQTRDVVGVEIERGAPRRSPSCADQQHCASVTVHVQGIAGTARVTYQCVADPGGTFHTGTLDPTASVVPDACAFGTPGARVWVETTTENVVDGGRVGTTARSNEVVW
jgi:hypothetical protein